MNIEIDINDKKIKLLLKEGNRIIDSIFWKEDRNLSQKLLVEIDNLLTKNRLDSSDIKKMEVKTGISEKFTTVRIAKVVANTFNFFNKK